jgi:toxin ParE1/3/4
VREELGPGIRGYPIERYVVLYRTTDAGVEIVHVLHGARDIETMFDKERL